MNQFVQLEINEKSRWIYFTKYRWVAHVLYWTWVLVIGTILNTSLTSKEAITPSVIFYNFFLVNLPIAAFFYTYCLVLIPIFFKRNRKMLFWMLVLLSMIIFPALNIYFNRLFPRIVELENVAKLSFIKQYLIQLFGYFFNFLIFSALLFFMEKNEENDTIQELENEQKEIEQVKLNLLKTNISPDFLMRSLQQLKRAAREQKEETSQSIITFSDLMRYRLYRGRQAFSPLTEELLALNSFISFIESEERNNLAIKLKVYGQTTEKNIAPLCLINILEFFCKTAPEKPASLKIEVTAGDTTIGMDLDYSAAADEKLLLDLEKYGVNYKQLYGDEVEFDLKNSENGHCIIKMHLPWIAPPGKP